MIKKISRNLLVLGVLLASALPGFSQLQPTPRDTSVVSLLFGAQVVSSIESYDVQPTWGSASVGLNYFRNGWDLSIRALLLSNQNNISSDNNRVFGRTVLTPGFSGAGFRALAFDISTPYFSDLLKNKKSGFLRRFRLNGYLNSSTMKWNYTGLVATGTQTASDVFVLGGGLNASFTLEKTFNGDNVLGLTFNAGFTTRFLLGDIYNTSSEGFRNLTLNTSSKAFGGFESGATLRLNWVYAKLGLTYFGGDTPGLSGWQETIAAGIMTDIHMTKARKHYPIKEKKKVTKRGSSMKR